jgi:hypothetical protein
MPRTGATARSTTPVRKGRGLVDTSRDPNTGFVPDIIHKFRKLGFNYPLAVHIRSHRTFVAKSVVLMMRHRKPV